MKSAWTLEDALPLIREIAPIAKRHGFSVALYGSVLQHGQSEKDLDLFFVEQEGDISNVQECLKEIGNLPEIHSCGNAIVCTGGWCGVIWLKDGRHIDTQFRRIANE